MLNKRYFLITLLVSCFYFSHTASLAFANQAQELSLSDALSLSHAQGRWQERSAIQSELAQVKYKSIEAKWHPILSVDAKLLYWNDESRLQILKEPLDLSTVPPMALPILQPMLGPLKNIEDGLVLREQFTALIGLQLVQPLTPLFQVYQAGELAKLGKTLATHEQSKEELAAKLLTTEDYLNLAYAQVMVELSEEAVQTIDAHLAQARRYESAGLIAHSSVLEAEYELLKAEQDALLAKEARRLAAMKLAHTLKLEPGSAVVASDYAAHNVEFKLRALHEYQEEAQAQRSELKMLEVAREAKEREAKIAILDYVPKLALVGRYEYAHGIKMQPEHQAFIGIALDWKFWDGLEAYYKSKEAKLKLRESELKDSESRGLIDLEVEKNYLNVQSALQSQELAEKSVELAQENLRIVQAQFDLGESVSTEVLAMHTKLSKSKADLAKARINSLRALANLETSVGMAITAQNHLSHKAYSEN
ncbi:MAG: TolC family protein [Bradymonadales bacterium]|jgi:outer membrane protein